MADVDKVLTITTSLSTNALYANTAEPGSMAIPDQHSGSLTSTTASTDSELGHITAGTDEMGNKDKPVDRALPESGRVMVRDSAQRTASAPDKDFGRIIASADAMQDDDRSGDSVLPESANTMGPETVKRILSDDERAGEGRAVVEKAVRLADRVVELIFKMTACHISFYNFKCVAEIGSAALVSTEFNEPLSVDQLSITQQQHLVTGLEVVTRAEMPNLLACYCKFRVLEPKLDAAEQQVDTCMQKISTLENSSGLEDTLKIFENLRRKQSSFRKTITTELRTFYIT